MFMGPLGPWWVAQLILAVGGLGLVAAVVARAKGLAFVPWLLYGVSLPVVALPHACIAGRGRGQGNGRGVLDRLAFRPNAAWIVLVLALIDVILVNFHRELFGTAWQYVMWEGGVIEGLTPLNFLLGTMVFFLAAYEARADRRRYRWLVVYALTDIFLAGEEISWGTGQILLDLDDPNFTTKYNPTTTLHHFLPGVGPIIIFFIVVAIFRLFYPWMRRHLDVPMSIGFLNAVLLTLLVAPFMRFDHEHFLFFDEVYEWSGSVLLLHLALWERWKCTFTR